MARFRIPDLLALVGIAGLAGCTGSWVDSRLAGRAPVLAREIAQAGGLDSATLLAIPSAVARDVAGDVLLSVSPDRLARSFAVDRYAGKPGLYRGFAPGFDGAVFIRSRFLRRGNLLVPYGPIDSHYIPIALSADSPPEMLFYPALVEESGILRPIFLAAPPPLLATYGLVYPTRVGATYVSPDDIGRVPPAAIDRPFIHLRTPGTTSVSTLGGGTTTSTTTATGGSGVSSVTGTTTGPAMTTVGGPAMTAITGPATTTTIGPAMTTTIGPATTTVTGPATTTTSTTGPATTMTSTTGRSVSSTVSTGPASVATTSATGRSVSSIVSTGPAGVTTTSATGSSISSIVGTGPAGVTATSSTGARGRHGLLVRGSPGSGRREDR